jgi:hypothetical protein
MLKKLLIFSAMAENIGNSKITGIVKEVKDNSIILKMPPKYP